MVRGSVVWVALDPGRGAEVPKTRPCIVVSRDISNEISRTVTVVPLSSIRGLILHLQLEDAAFGSA